jgi:hypothetical protein
MQVVSKQIHRKDRKRYKLNAGTVPRIFAKDTLDED